VLILLIARQLRDFIYNLDKTHSHIHMLKPLVFKLVIISSSGILDIHKQNNAFTTACLSHPRICKRTGCCLQAGCNGTHNA
jgi:hypothetical protein